MFMLLLPTTKDISFILLVYVSLYLDFFIIMNEFIYYKEGNGIKLIVQKYYT